VGGPNQEAAPDESILLCPALSALSADADKRYGFCRLSGGVAGILEIFAEMNLFG
jgi:hypothetical protein